MIVVVVSTVLIDYNKILLIQEGKDKCYGKWNLPSGRLEAGEGIIDGAIRETKEETGYRVEIKDLTGVYNFTSDIGHQVVAMNFIGEIIDGDLQYDGKEVINAKWFTLDEIDNLKDIELRNPHFIRKIITDIRNGKRLPLSIIQDIF